MLTCAGYISFDLLDVPTCSALKVFVPLSRVVQGNRMLPGFCLWLYLPLALCIKKHRVEYLFKLPCFDVENPKPAECSSLMWHRVKCIFGNFVPLWSGFNFALQHSCFYLYVPLYWSNLMVWWYASVTLRKGTRPLLWRCTVTVLHLPWPELRHLWGTSMVRLPMSALAPELHVGWTSTCLGKSQNYLSGFAWAPVILFCILTGCRMSGFWDFSFLLVLEGKVWSEALGLWCIYGKSARRKGRVWSQCDACLIFHMKKLLFATCILWSLHLVSRQPRPCFH